MGWLNKRKASKTTIYYLAREKSLEKLATTKAANASLYSGQFEDTFKKYFADPLDIGTLKKIQ